MRNVSVARGNVVLADHGLTTTRDRHARRPDRRRPARLSHGPLTMQRRAATRVADAGRFGADRRRARRRRARGAARRSTLLVDHAGRRRRTWTSVPDLLDSGPFDEQLRGRGRRRRAAPLLRFGDGEYGRALAGRDGARRRLPRRQRPRRATSALEAHRPRRAAGDRRRLDHARPQPAGRARRRRRRDDRAGPPARAAGLPQPSCSARSPRPTGSRRRCACPTSPARSRPIRWTGSWTRSSSPSIRATGRTSSTCPTAARRLEPGFERRVRAFLTRFRLAGYDIELRPPRFVAVELAIEVCARAGYFRSDVRPGGPRRARRTACSPTASRGFFHPDNFTFGDPRLPEPALRGGRARRGRRLRGHPQARALRAGRTPASSSAGALDDRPLGDRAPGQRPELRRARRADGDRARGQGMNALPCGCCEPRAPLTPLAVVNRAGLTAIAYRVGTYASFRETMLEDIARAPELAAPHDARGRRLRGHAPRPVGRGRRRTDLLPGALRQRGVPAHRDAARRRSARLARADRLPACAPASPRSRGWPSPSMRASCSTCRCACACRACPARTSSPQVFETIEAIRADARLNRRACAAAALRRQPARAGAHRGARASRASTAWTAWPASRPATA